LKIVNPPVRLKYRDNSANIEVYMQCGEIEKSELGGNQKNARKKIAEYNNIGY
jgi:hypothetical protein